MGAVAPEAPVYREYAMAFLARRSTTELSFTMLTFAVVSGLTLLLAAVGLYGVLSSVVAGRTREIGVRMVKAVEPDLFVLMVVIGLVASYMPARRASSVDPVVSLRSD